MVLFEVEMKWSYELICFDNLILMVVHSTLDTFAV